MSDFGLLRELPRDDSIYHMTTSVPCPVRWMAPESIEQRDFSPASDVWSFGILQWEMFNPNKMPYQNLGNIEVAMKVGMKALDKEVWVSLGLIAIKGFPVLTVLLSMFPLFLVSWVFNYY